MLQSFGKIMFNQKYDNLFFAYKTIFVAKWFYDSFFFSIFVAFTSTFLSIINGILISFFIWRLPFRYKKYAIVYKIPLILPHIAIAFIVLILFSKTGVLSSIFFRLGIISASNQFPDLLYSQSGIDIIFAYVFKETPFAVLMISAVLLRFDERLLDTAKMFGAGIIKSFFKIILPFLMPIINTTFIILFLYSFGAFDIPFVIGQSYPSMLSIQVYKYFFNKDLQYRPIAMALLTIMLIFSIFFTYLYTMIVRKLDSDQRKI